MNVDTQSETQQSDSADGTKNRENPTVKNTMNSPTLARWSTGILRERNGDVSGYVSCVYSAFDTTSLAQFLYDVQEVYNSLLDKTVYDSKDKDILDKDEKKT